MIENHFTSGNHRWNDTMTFETMRLCRKQFGTCNFIFASKLPNEQFMDNGVVSCKQLTVRQTALMNNYSDLFVGVGSGISVATSCWGNKPTPKIQFTGSFICSTVSLANGPIEFIDYDYKPEAEKEYYTKLEVMLAKI